MDADLSLACQVVLTPRRAGLCAGQGNAVEVLVRIQAPDAPAAAPAAHLGAAQASSVVGPAARLLG